MALVRKITKAVHAALNPLLQAEYKAEGEDFVLDATGFDDPAELRRAKEREVENARILREENAALKTQVETISRTTGDVKTLEISWQAKLEKEKKDHEKAMEKQNQFIQSTLVDSVANQLASELSGDNAAIILPHIKSRLKAEVTGDTPLTRVLDKEGKPSALSVTDLATEFKADPRFKAIIIASKASGGGAAGGGQKPVNGGTGGEKKFKDLTDNERTDWYKRDPKGFQEASTAYQQEVLAARLTVPRSM